MSDYVVGGMKLAPVDPTFLEQRDAILAAAYAQDPEDASRLAAAFAHRGAGTCAEGPPPDSSDHAGVVESFDVGANFAVLSVDLDDSITPCDGDGILDANEVGEVTVEVMNAGLVPLTGTKAKLSSATPGVTFPDGDEVPFSAIAPFATATATIQIALDGSSEAIGFLDLSAKVTHPDGCVPERSVSLSRRIRYDNLPEGSAIDAVEAAAPGFTPTGEGADDVWAREQTDPMNRAWHGIDSGDLSDTQLESPPLDVSMTEPFRVTFKHRHSFEASDGTFWDGGVIEISTLASPPSGAGAPWVDISALADPGYGGTITEEGGNPLSDREGFVSTNPSWPERDTVTLDLGAALAGQTVRIRFRIGADMYVGDFGWELDDLDFKGITNAPFPRIVEDSNVCSGPPIADAGTDALLHHLREDSSCDCSTPGAAGPRGAAGAALLGAAALLLRRRRSGRLGRRAGARTRASRA
jgi:MYXO-CTERM domain-containing protein